MRRLRAVGRGRFASGALLGFAAIGCAPEPPPANERDVARALAAEVLAPLGEALATLRPSDCRTDGETDVAVPAALFAAFLAANDLGGDGSRAGLDRADLGRLAPRLRLLAPDESPLAASIRERKPVVALSRIGIAGDEALACVEAFGADQRGFLVLLRRARGGAWAVHAELEAWREETPPPEELPDGTLYEPDRAAP